MTPADLFQHLVALGVTLTPSAAGGLRVRAPVGVLTPDLVEAMRVCKPALLVLARPAQSSAEPPQRQWVTGGWPDTAPPPLGKALDAPKYHDVPQVPRTLLKLACPTQRCKPTGQSPSGKPLSLYYRPSGLCVACHAKLTAKKGHTKKPRVKARSKEK